MDDKQARKASDLSSVSATTGNYSGGLTVPSKVPPVTPRKGSKADIDQRIKAVRDVTGPVDFDRMHNYYGVDKRPEANNAGMGINIMTLFK